MPDSWEGVVAKALVRSGSLTRSEILFVLTDHARAQGMPNPRKRAARELNRTLTKLRDAGCRSVAGGGLSL